MILGMLHPHRGAVHVFGVDPRDEPVVVKQRIGYVSDAQVLPPYLRAREVFALHAELFPKWDSKLAQKLEERFDIAGAKKIRDMSKGEARRVAVACAIAHRPELLLLDEPSSGFDPAARREFLEVALEHLAETESTILFSSHQLDDVERLASRILFLHGSDRCVTARVVGDEVLSLFRGAQSEALEQALAASPALSLAPRAPRLEDVFIELAESNVQPREVR